jgi:hypothetical protein
MYHSFHQSAVALCSPRWAAAGPSPPDSPFRPVGRGQRACQTDYSGSRRVPFSAPPPSRLPFRSTPRLTSPSSATSALTYTRSDPTARPGHLDSCHLLPSLHRAAQTRGSPPARSFPLWCAPSRLLFARQYCALPPTLSREAVAVRDGTRHHIERAINSIRRIRTTLQHAARDAARHAATALRCAAVHEQRPHQV